MQITLRPLDLVSRALAVALVAVPVTWLVIQLGVWEMEDVARMTHQELVQYLKEGADTNFAPVYARMLLILFVCVCLVEAVAWVGRAIVRAAQPTPAEGAAARW